MCVRDFRFDMIENKCSLFTFRTNEDKNQKYNYSKENINDSNISTDSETTITVSEQFINYLSV